MSVNWNSCDAVRDRIDAYLDGELDSAGCAALEQHCAACRPCGRELALARRVHAELRSLPVLSAPERTIAAAEREIATSNVVQLRVPARRRRTRTLLAAAAVVVAAASVWFAMHSRTAPPPGYSDAEIRQASEELALAFGYVDHYSNQAAAIIENDVIQRRVAPRIGRALNTSREAVIDDAIVPGIRRAVRESGLNVTSPPPGRS